MHFDHMSALDARHLVLAYVSVAVIQGGYLIWVLRDWLKLRAEQEKSAKPVR